MKLMYLWQDTACLLLGITPPQSTNYTNGSCDDERSERFYAVALAASGVRGGTVGVSDGVGVSEAVGDAIGVQTGMVPVGNGVMAETPSPCPSHNGGTL